MSKISVDDLRKIKESQRHTLALRGGDFRAKVVVNMGTCGIAAGARDVITALNEAIAQKEIMDVMLTASGCGGYCAKEPTMLVETPEQPPTFYGPVDKKKALKIFKEHVLGGKIVTELVAPSKLAEEEAPSEEAPTEEASKSESPPKPAPKEAAPKESVAKKPAGKKEPRKKAAPKE